MQASPSLLCTECLRGEFKYENSAQAKIPNMSPYRLNLGMFRSHFWVPSLQSIGGEVGRGRAPIGHRKEETQQCVCESGCLEHKANTYHLSRSQTHYIQPNPRPLHMRRQTCNTHSTEPNLHGVWGKNASSHLRLLGRLLCVFNILQTPVFHRDSKN